MSSPSTIASGHSQSLCKCPVLLPSLQVTLSLSVRVQSFYHHFRPPLVFSASVQSFYNCFRSPSVSLCVSSHSTIASGHPQSLCKCLVLLPSLQATLSLLCPCPVLLPSLQITLSLLCKCPVLLSSLQVTLSLLCKCPVLLSSLQSTLSHICPCLVLIYGSSLQSTLSLSVRVQSFYHRFRPLLVFSVRFQSSTDHRFRPPLAFCPCPVLSSLQATFSLLFVSSPSTIASGHS